MKPARVVGIALNTSGLNRRGVAARRSKRLARRRTCRSDDFVRYGAARLLRCDRARDRRQETDHAQPARRDRSRAGRGPRALLLTAAAPAPRHPWTRPGHLRMGFTDEPDGLNPHVRAHVRDRRSGLADLCDLVPLRSSGATSSRIWRPKFPATPTAGISRDGKTITLHLRRGARWADGAPLTARDLRFTYRAVMNPRNNVKTRDGWNDIVRSSCPTTIRRWCICARPTPICWASSRWGLGLSAAARARAGRRSPISTGPVQRGAPGQRAVRAYQMEPRLVAGVRREPALLAGTAAPRSHHVARDPQRRLALQCAGRA